MAERSVSFERSNTGSRKPHFPTKEELFRRRESLDNKEHYSKFTFCENKNSNGTKSLKQSHQKERREQKFYDVEERGAPVKENKDKEKEKIVGKTTVNDNEVEDQEELSTPQRVPQPVAQREPSMVDIWNLIQETS